MTEFASYPSLRDRVAFVSGGASGLGAEFVAQLAAQGCRVGFVDVQDGAPVAAAAAAAGHPEPFFQHCDVRDVHALQAAIAATAERFGPVTVLVNNAANDVRIPVEEITAEKWDELSEINVRHHFFAAQAVTPMMREAGGGSVINLGSISAHIDLLELPVYITAKAGIEGLTHTLARELGQFGIRVNCVLPGWIMTERQLTNWVTPEAEAASPATSACRTSSTRPTSRASCSGSRPTTAGCAPHSDGSWMEVGWRAPLLEGIGRIGFGAWQIGDDAWGPVAEGGAMDALAAAADAGVTFFDTADVYGDGTSERLVGRFLAERGDPSLVVATKMGRRVEQVADNYRPDAFREWLERSRENLQVERIPLVQLHCPPTEVYYRPEVFEALDQLVADGVIAATG